MNRNAGPNAATWTACIDRRGHSLDQPTTYVGGDTIVVGALCAGLQRVGDLLIAAGCFDEQAVVGRLCKDDGFRDAFEQAANQYLSQIAHLRGSRIDVHGFVPKYRREDFAVSYSWNHNGATELGMYPVNTKDEKSEKNAKGLARVAKRYGLFNRLTGQDVTLHTNAAELLAESVTGGIGLDADESTGPTDGIVALGLGVLALCADGGKRHAVTYDALHTFAALGGPSVCDVEAKGPLRELFVDVERFCTDHHLNPMDVYTNEGYLLQAKHREAARVFWYVAEQCAARGVYCCTLLQWFAARFDDAVVRKEEERLETIRRDRLAACSLL